MNKMYRYICFFAVALVAVIAVGCDNEQSFDAEGDMRTITVDFTSTRTTIDYEGSDVSHMVWQDGDQVAYITDVAGATFTTATVVGNQFTATIPAEAQKIMALYPVGANEGKTLVEARASLSAEITQRAEDGFDGKLLPMYGEAETPKASSVVGMSYTCLASVLRLTVLGDEERVGEVLQSVTLTAAESVVGDFVVDVATGGLATEGTSQSVMVEYTGDDDKLYLSNSHDIYMVLFAESFTDVDVVVETNQDSYFWLDGSMDLSNPERRLYRTTLDIAKSVGAPEPQDPIFVPVLSLNEITDDGTYLIAVNVDGKYLVTNNVPTDSSNYYWLTGVEASSNESGVVASEEIMNYTWSITRKSDGYEFYSANMLKQGTYGVVLITQGGSGMFSNEDGYEGKAWFVTRDTVDGYSDAQQPRRYWDIELDGEGKAVLRNKYDRGVDMFPCYKYCPDHGWFTLCFEGGDVEKLDISLLKYQE